MPREDPGLNLGVFGGTFDPIHLAHLRVAEEVREALALDRVLFVPAAEPRLRHAPAASAEHRLEMVRLACAGNGSFEVSRLELDRGGPTRSFETLEELARENAGARLWFLLGADAFERIGSWHRPERLFELASFAVLSRPGSARDAQARLPAPLAGACRADGDTQIHTSGNEIRSIAVSALAISASDVRRRIASGLSARYLVPDAVSQYIAKHRLYEEKT